MIPLQKKRKYGPWHIMTTSASLSSRGGRQKTLAGTIRMQTIHPPRKITLGYNRVIQGIGYISGVLVTKPKDVMSIENGLSASWTI